MIAREFDPRLACPGFVWSGRVEGVFRTAALVRGEGGGPLVTLVATDGIGVPFGIRLPAGSVLPAPGTVVRIVDGVLEQGNSEAGTTIRMEGPGSVLRVDGNLPFDATVLAAQLRELPLPLRTRALLGRVEALPDTVENRTVQKAVDALAGLTAWLVGQGPAVPASRLSGLGPGSTPTGDDLLVGLLAAVTRLSAAGVVDPGRGDALRANVRGLPRDCTTPLAREMLDHAADGWFPEPLARFAAGLGAPTGKRETLAVMAAAVARVGATSGPDWLAGCLRVPKRIVDRNFRNPVLNRRW